MRILVCNWKDLEHPQAGGAEVWTHGVASAWVRAGHDVTLACSSAPGLDATSERDGVRIERGGDYRFGVHRHARSLYDRERGRFDLVVDEINTRPFGAPRWATRSEVVGFIHQVAREVWFHETPRLVALAGRFVLEPHWLRQYRAVPMFAPSPSSAASLQLYGLDHVRALPQGSDHNDVPAFAPAKAARPTFVFLGRLCAMKRPLDAVAAFRHVQTAVPDAQLWVVGDGPEARRVRRHAGDGIEVLGHVSRSERDARLASAHALVATSVREGWGLMVSDAAAAGTGAIGYAVPGLVDSIAATGGVLVEPTPAALAAAMLDVAVDPVRAPHPVSTGTQPFAEVASLLLGSIVGAVHA